MRAAMAALAVVGLAGCNSGGNPYSYEGFTMSSFFPFDGQRDWTFLQDGVVHELLATLDPEFEVVDSLRIYKVDYALQCPAGIDGCEPAEHAFSQLRWSSDAGNGTLIHAIQGPAGEQVFDPPIALTADRGKKGDVVTTETGGATFTARFDDLVPCPIRYTDQWEQCAKIVLDDDDNPETAGSHPLHGDWFAVAGYNVVAMQLIGDAAQWQLNDATYEELE
jgi:hypothetical protein